MQKIVIEHYGGADQLISATSETQVPGAGEVLVNISAAGVNFMDIGVRDGRFWPDSVLPFTPGVEGAGQIVALGDSVDSFRIGDRVAWFYVPGSYAEQVVAPIDALVRIPDGISDETAAGLMMQGLTASHFVTEVYAIKPGDIALVHSAAGGVGLLLTQLIKQLGGTVIGRVSTERKAEIARAAGADHVIVESGGTFADDVMRITGGEGVHVVYDGSGSTTFTDSIASLRYHGVFVNFGVVLGKSAPINMFSLPRSILITYPMVGHHVLTPQMLQTRSQQLFDWVESGTLKVEIGHRYPLAEAGRAHREMETRQTSGKLLLIP